MAGPMNTGNPSIGGVGDKGVQLELLLRDVAAETGCLMSLLSPLPVVAWERRGRRPQKGGQFGIR